MNRIETRAQYRRRRRRLERLYYFTISGLLVIALALMIPITLFASTEGENKTSSRPKNRSTEKAETSTQVNEYPIVYLKPYENLSKTAIEATNVTETITVLENTTAAIEVGAIQLMPIVEVQSEPLVIEVADVTVDINTIIDCYYYENEYGVMNRDDDSTINACINFFYEQMNISPEIVAGIIGNVCVEGHFGEEQNSYEIASSVDDYLVKLLDDKNKGYGIAQWTHDSRRADLAEQIVEVREHLMTEYNFSYEECTYGEYYPIAIVLGECIHLYYELQDYEIFDSYDESYTLEDATGRVALLYERYKNSAKHWEQDHTGKVYLIGSTESSGARRLNFAELVYDRIMVN